MIRRFKQRLLLSGVIATSLVALPISTYGWSAPGHQVVTAIAWNDLTPEARSEAVRVLRTLPRFDKDIIENMPDGLSPVEQERFILMKASTWPDIIRGRHPLSQSQHRGVWHYVNFPLVPAGDPPPWAPPEPRFDVGAASPGNIVDAISHNAAILRRTDASDEQKGIAVAWVLHLVGDIHQPLHSVALFSGQFPTGDQGGNKFIVRTFDNARNDNLHSVWDGLFGTHGGTAYATADKITTTILATAALSRAALADALETTAPAEWSWEGVEFARVHVYGLETTSPISGLNKDNLPPPSRGETPPPAPVLPHGYLQKSREIARSRVAVAGYRLADLLNDVLVPDPAARPGIMAEDSM